VFVDAGAFTCHCIATASSSGPALPPFGHYVTLRIGTLRQLIYDSLYMYSLTKRIICTNTSVEISVEASFHIVSQILELVSKKCITIYR
jgi:hypothetical protein